MTFSTYGYDKGIGLAIRHPATKGLCNGGNLTWGGGGGGGPKSKR